MTEPGTLRRIFPLVAAGVLIALLVVGWWFLAPPQLGGRTTYVTTVGNSMEPGVVAGDLVVVRPAGSYTVGDVVAYRSSSLHAVVLHRIVDVQDGRYVLKGDHNSWIDTDRPSPGDLLGSMVARLPGMGSRLQSLRSPLGVALLVGVGALGLVAGSFGRRRRRRSPSEGAEPSRRAAPSDSRRGSVRATEPVAVRVLGAAAVAFLALGAVTFAWPETTSVNRAIAYEQQGAFRYGAPVPDGEAVYGGDGVVTGDPVYLRLADQLHVTFTYRLDTLAPSSVTGTIGLAARVSDTDGWVRVFELAPTKPLTETEAQIGGTLDLGSLESLIARVQQLTKVERDAYAVTIVPEVSGTGVLSGRSVPLSFAPELPFLLNDRELQIAPGDTPVATLLQPTNGDLLRVQGIGPNEISVFGLHLTPAQVRTVCFAAAAVLMLALLILLGIGRRSRERGEHERIEARYGRMLVSVVGGTADRLPQAVDVDSMETLVLLAAHYDQVVLHDDAGGRHTYFFRDGGIAYRYRPRGEVDAAGADAAMSL